MKMHFLSTLQSRLIQMDGIGNNADTDDDGDGVEDSLDIPTDPAMLTPTMMVSATTLTWTMITMGRRMRLTLFLWIPPKL